MLQGVIQERDVGQQTTLDVLNAQAEVTSAREGLIQAQTSRVIAAFALIAATGRLTAEDLGLNVGIKRIEGEKYAAKVEDVWAELELSTDPRRRIVSCIARLADRGPACTGSQLRAVVLVSAMTNHAAVDRVRAVPLRHEARPL